MLSASYLGPSVSPGELFFQKEIQREGLVDSPSLGEPSKPSSLLQSIRSIFSVHDGGKKGKEGKATVKKVVNELEDYSYPSIADERRGTSVNEELAWYRDKVVWSKGNVVFRTFSFEIEKENVVMALFAWFNDDQEEDSSAKLSHQGNNDIKPDDVSIPSGNTFGPFSTSQRATWSDPRRMRKETSPTSTRSFPRRCLVVLLETQAHIYLPSGKVEVVTFPFAVDYVWPLKSGGLIIQRALGRKERQANGKGKDRVMEDGIRISDDIALGSAMDSILDELGDAEPTMGEGANARLTDARMFYLRHPACEVTVLGRSTSLQGGYIDKHGKSTKAAATGPIFSLPISSETLWVSYEPYPLVLTMEHDTGQLVFYRWARLATPATVSVGIETPPLNLLQSPELVDMQADPAVPPVPAHPAQRPSLGRQRSSYAPTGDRRKSGMGLAVSGGRSPATKNRRVSFHQDPHPPTGSAEVTSSSNALRAALDTSTNIPHAGAASHVRADVDPPGVASRSGARRVSKGPRDAENARILLNHANEIDVRETTMLMGLEESEEETVAEIVLEEFHRWDMDGLRNIQSQNIRIFLSDTTWSGSAHVNVHIQAPISSLYVFKLDLQAGFRGYNLQPLAKHDATSAVPIICLRQDIADVALTKRGSDHIHVLSGTSIELALNVPALTVDGRDEMAHAMASTLSMSIPEGVPADIQPLQDEYAFTLFHPAGSRVSLQVARGQHLLLDIDKTITNRLVNQCMRAIDRLAPDAAVKLVRLGLFYTVASRPKGGDEFDNFRSVILTICGALDTYVSVDMDAFQQVLASASRTSSPDMRKLVNMAGPSESSNTDSAAPMGHERVDALTVELILMALHLVAQECLLDTARTTDLWRLAQLIVDVAQHRHAPLYVDYWWRLSPSLNVRSIPTAAEKKPVIGEPFDCFQVLDNILRGGKPTTVGRILAKTCKTTGVSPCQSLGRGSFTPQLDNIMKVYWVYARTRGKLWQHQSSALALAQGSAVLLTMIEQGIDDRRLRRYPWGIALPLLEVVKHYKDNPPRDLPLEVYTMIGRVDIACQLSPGQRGLDLDTGKVTVAKIVAGPPSSAQHIDQLMQNHAPTPNTNQNASGSPEHHFHLPELRFTQDRRLQDAERMLQTARKRIMRPEDRPHYSDHELDQYHQALTNNVAMRTLSQLVGRGLLTYGTQIASITAPLRSPPINLEVYLTIPKRTFAAKSPSPHADPAGWPSFHNGVATGLSLRSDNKVIDSSWIIFNKPETPSAEHGGFLLGLGLTGHLRTMVSWHAYPYLEPRHDYTSIGILLGLAASYTGSQDKLLTRILSLNVQALLPDGAFDLNSPPSVQAASLLGIGLVYLGSSNHRMADVALDQIGRNVIPGIEHFADHREAYSFSAACSFGLIMLGRGSRRSGEMETHLVARLRSCILGTSPTLDGPRTAPSETDIDINVTAPGATLALGMMFLKSNRADVSSMISLPNSPYELDHIRPDLLLIRALAINMIHWQDVQPTQDWVRSCVPSFILTAYDNKQAVGHIDETIELAFYYIVAGCCFTLGLKYASSISESAHGVLLHYYNVFGGAAALPSQTYEAKLRRTAVRQGFCVVTISLAMVVAGSGDLSVYRRLRIAHATDNAYVTRQAIHTAAGLVFLGAGKYSLGTSDAAVACMAIAFFPRFSSLPDDNRAYLQAYRHLWALAVEPRCFVTTDASTLSKVYLPIKIKYRDETGTIKVKQGISPTLLDSLDRVVAVSTQSPRYSSTSLNLTRPDDLQRLVRSQMLFVRRKPAFLDYFADSKGYRTFQSSVAPFQVHGQEDARNVPGLGLRPVVDSSDLVRLIDLHTKDPLVRAVTRMFGREALEDTARSNAEFSLGAACEAVVTECILADRLFMLPIYLAIFAGLNTADHRFGMLNLAQFKMAKRYLSTSPVDSDKVLVVRLALIDSTIEQTKRAQGTMTQWDKTTVARFFESIGSRPLDIQTIRQRVALAMYLAVHNAPGLAELLDLYQRIDFRLSQTYLDDSIPPDARNAVLRSVLRDMVQSNVRLNPQTTTAYDNLTDSEKAKLRAEKRVIMTTRLGTLDGVWSDAGMLDALRSWLKERP